MKEKMSERIGYEGIVEKNAYHKIVGGSGHGHGLYISHVFDYLDEASSAATEGRGAFSV